MRPRPSPPISTVEWPPERGHICLVEIQADTPKYVVVVSNNMRNQAYGSFLAVRVTTSDKPEIASCVRLPDGLPIHGTALCDDIFMLRRKNVIKSIGALPLSVMMEIDKGLVHALSLTRDGV